MQALAGKKDKEISFFSSKSELKSAVEVCGKEGKPGKCVSSLIEEKVRRQAYLLILAAGVVGYMAGSRK